MKLHIDLVSCTGTALCTFEAPNLLRFVDGPPPRAEVIEDGQASDEEYWAAAHSCPWQAVILEDDDGNRLFP